MSLDVHGCQRKYSNLQDHSCFVRCDEFPRGLIELVMLIPGAKRREMDVTLYGGLDAILDWIEAQENSGNGSNRKHARRCSCGSVWLGGCGG